MARLGSHAVAKHTTLAPNQALRSGRTPLAPGSRPQGRRGSQVRLLRRFTFDGGLDLAVASASRLAGSARSGRVAGPVQAVEDQVEPEFVLVAVVVARPEDVLYGQFGEVGVLVG